MKQRFDDFIAQLKETNATLDFYCDFEKIIENVEDVAISLCTLNFLIGKQDVRSAVEAIWKRDRKAFEALDILIATRRSDNKKFVDHDGKVRPIRSLYESVDGVVKFLEETGLAEVFKKAEIKDLHDYVFGVETGLDTNARKNRSGLIIEKMVARMLKQADIQFREQVSSNEFPKVKELLGVDQKVFDFVVESGKTTYLIEVNFYSGGGSKLNEVARAYTDIAPKINHIEGFEFVWITDGKGWNSARNKLQEAFKAIPQIYNLHTLPNFISSLK